MKDKGLDRYERMPDSPGPAALPLVEENSDAAAVSTSHAGPSGADECSAIAPLESHQHTRHSGARSQQPCESTPDTQQLQGSPSSIEAGPSQTAAPLAGTIGDIISKDNHPLAAQKLSGAESGERPSLDPQHSSCLSGAGECRICLLSEPVDDLVTPCACTGSLRYAHLTCLKTWVAEKRQLTCELCNTHYVEPYSAQLAQSIPAVSPEAINEARQRLIVNLGQVMNAHSAAAAALAAAQQQQQQQAAAAIAELERTQRPCEWRSMWSYILILILLFFAVLYVTVFSKRGKHEAWMDTLWQVLLVVLPVYLVLRISFDIYRHRLAQQLAAAAAEAQAAGRLQPGLGVPLPLSHVSHNTMSRGGDTGRDAVSLSNSLAGAMMAGATVHSAGPNHVIITPGGNRILVVSRV